MSSEPPTPDPVFIQTRVNQIAEKAMQSIAVGNPFTITIVMPQNVDGIYTGLQAMLTSYNVALDTTTNEITISAPAPAPAPAEPAPAEPAPAE